MKSPDVLLAVPPFDFSEMNSSGGGRARQGGYYLYYPPLGLCSIAAALEKEGFTVGIVDGQVDAGSEEEFLRLIESERPGLFGIGVTTPALPVVGRVVRAVRERLGIPVIAGGPHVSCDPEIVRALGADYGVVGDGEGPTALLARFILRGRPLPEGTPGIMTPDSPAPPPPAVADLDALPVPERQLLRNPDAYFNPFFHTRTTTLLSARGCPFHCSFCCRTLSMGDYRPIGIGRVLDEMELLQREGYGFISLIDETFTYDRERAIGLARGMTRRGFDFRWSCQTRADLVDEEALREFRKAGCVNISFGVEAGDQSVRENLDKRISDADVERALEACRKAGITTNAFMIVGAPGETPEQIERGIRRAVELEPDYVVYNIGTLFPGTREYEKRVAAGRIDRTVWDRYARGEAPLPVLSETVSRPELAGFLRRGYSKFYLRPRYILRKIGSVRSARDVMALARRARTVVADYVFS